MTINSDGLVGIGTDNPEADLHIRDNNPKIRFEDPNVDNNYKLLQFMQTGTLGGASYGYKFSWRNDDGSIRSDTMWLDQSGQIWFTDKVGIMTGSMVSYTFEVNGDAYCTGSWSGSDIRWKKDIKPIESSLEKINRISGVSYRWKTEEYKDFNFDNDRHIGIIAQEMEKVFPELVNTNDDGYKAVAYDKLTAVLLEAVKEQQDQIETLQQRIKELEEAVLSEYKRKIVLHRLTDERLKKKYGMGFEAFEEKNIVKEKKFHGKLKKMQWTGSMQSREKNISKKRLMQLGRSQVRRLKR